jgi:hypothetical protein
VAFVRPDLAHGAVRRTRAVRSTQEILTATGEMAPLRRGHFAPGDRAGMLPGNPEAIDPSVRVRTSVRDEDFGARRAGRSEALMSEVGADQVAIPRYWPGSRLLSPTSEALAHRDPNPLVSAGVTQPTPRHRPEPARRTIGGRMVQCPHRHEFDGGKRRLGVGVPLANRDNANVARRGHNAGRAV